MEFTFVLPVPFYRTAEGQFICESAFAKHLAELRDRMAPAGFTSMRVCGPTMSELDYRQIASHAGVIDEQRDRIYLTELNPVGARAGEFWIRHAAGNLRKIWRAVQQSGLIQSGPSMNIFHPNEIAALVCARLQGRKTIAVVDIDVRNDMARARKLKMISPSRYWIEHGLLDPLRRAQLRWVARHCSLVLFKGKALVDDYGGGRPSVKNFFDTAHSASHVIPAATMERKAHRVLSADRPLRCVYFGRIVQRKGVDLCIQAVAAARDRSRADITLTILGDGPEKAAAVALVAQLGAQSYVKFVPPVAFGMALFEALYDFDVLLAAPRTEDTPRSAFDAMAAGMALCAYDTDYYRSLAQFGPMVVVSPWMSIDGMADTITAFSRDRARLAQAQQAARRMALENTQEAWLDIRAGWTREFCGAA